MTKFNTGNPVGSSDPRDLSDNASVADNLVTGEAASYKDRLGRPRRSWQSVEDQVSQQEAEFNAAQDDRQGVFRQYLISAGYQFAGDYAAGNEITQYNQVLRDTSGEFWRLSGGVSLPYTTTGAGMPEGGAFVSVGDATLRQDLAGEPGSGKGAAKVNGATIHLSSVAESLSAFQGVTGQRYEVTGWHEGSKEGGQSLLYDPNEPKSNHGLTGWSPTVPAVSQQAGGSLAERRDNYLKAIGETDTGGTGLFVIMESALYPDTYGALEGLDDTLPVQRATDVRAEQGGGFVAFKPRIYLATRLEPRSSVTWFGTWGSSYLQCTDSTTIDANSAIGSFIKAPDDGNRVVRFGIEGVSIVSALSGVAGSQDTFRDIVGLSLCACERTTLKDINFSGFGQGAIVLARAEAGAEGLGFVNTTQDGNYNTGMNINIAACGKYNPLEAALWLKYKANSNKFFATYFKGSTFVSFGIQHGNDNLFSGSTTESAKSIAYFGPLANGNVIQSARAEVLSSHAYDFHDDASSNSILGGYYTGVSGNFANNIENTTANIILDPQTIWMGVQEFPPSSSVSTRHFQQVASFRAVNGDNNRPLWIKSPAHDVSGTYPVVRAWDSKVTLSAGDVIGAFEFYNRDQSTGAEGVSARMIAVAESTTGRTALAFWTGTGTNAAERFRVKSNGDVEMADAGAGVILKSPNGTSYRLTVDDGGSILATAQ